MQALEIIALSGGIVAGFLGALFGIGGGVILVPILNGLMGMTFAEARGVSLIGVLGTSSSSVLAPAGRRLVNPRLAIYLLFFSVSGAIIAAKYLGGFSERTYEILFGISMGFVAVLMLSRRNVRNVLPADTGDLGVFGGQMHDDEHSCEMAYRVRRLPVASVVAFGAGMLASLIGIGGGIVIVPALNSLCGVPMRVAAATGVLIIGVTAIPGSLAAWASGSLGDYHIAGMTCLGAIVGYQIGIRVGPRAAVKSLKMALAALMVCVSVQYLFLR